LDVAVDRLLVAAALAAAAVAVAALIQRRRPDPPTQARWRVPSLLDRADFTRPDAPWLVAVFSSSTCDACQAALAKAEVLASDAVAVQEVEAGAQAALHQRYRIEAVPLIVVADAEGVVQASFLGTPTATDLWAAVADARQKPG
jgi:hypothetical protein